MDKQNKNTKVRVLPTESHSERRKISRKISEKRSRRREVIFIALTRRRRGRDPSVSTRMTATSGHVASHDSPTRTTSPRSNGSCMLSTAPTVQMGSAVDRGHRPSNCVSTEESDRRQRTPCRFYSGAGSEEIHMRCEGLFQNYNFWSIRCREREAGSTTSSSEGGKLKELLKLCNWLKKSAFFFFFKKKLKRMFYLLFYIKNIFYFISEL